MRQVEYRTQAPVVCRADVAVLGGGPAGIAAAVASARHGCKTVLIERYGYLGGMATVGLVAPFMKCYTVDGMTQIIRGIYDEFIRRMEDMGGAIHPSKIKTGTPQTGYLTFGQDHITPIEPEAVKRVADELMEEAGVRVLFHTMFVDAVATADSIDHMVVCDKTGLKAVCAKQYIDCSGDGDMAAGCGVPFVLGDGSGVMQPATTIFRVSGVCTEKTTQYVQENPDDFMFIKLADIARAAGDFSINRRRAIIFETVHPGQWMVNATRIQDLDGTDPDQKSRAEAEGRRQVGIAFAFLKKYVPGFEEAVLMDSSAEVGIRESRHIEGAYTLTGEDVLTGRSFGDCIAVSGFPMDIHDHSGRADQFIQPQGAQYYQIPYRCLLPKGVSNLLVAGRPVSTTHQAAAAIRVMPTCFAMGQAAGTAAALAVVGDVAPAEVAVDKLRRQLIDDGACLGL